MEVQKIQPKHTFAIDLYNNTIKTSTVRSYYAFHFFVKATVQYNRTRVTGCFKGIAYLCHYAGHF